MKAFALVFLLFAASPIVIDTTKIADGATDVRREGSRTVGVSRSGKTVTVRVDEGKRVDTITMTREADGRLTISHKDNGEPRRIIAMDRRPVIVDGVDLEPFMAGNFFGQQHAEPPAAPQAPSQPERRRQDDRPRYYICPKDQTMVRVLPGRGPDTLICPLDGTPMIAGTGRDSQIWLIE